MTAVVCGSGCGTITNVCVCSFELELDLLCLLKFVYDALNGDCGIAEVSNALITAQWFCSVVLVVCDCDLFEFISEKRCFNAESIDCDLSAGVVGNSIKLHN